jgi:hypothetical protein
LDGSGDPWGDIVTWNYRVMVRGGRYAVYEVYYADDGRITHFSEEPTYPCGESIEDLAEDFERYRRALAEPALNYEALEVEVARPRVADA